MISDERWEGRGRGRRNNFLALCSGKGVGRLPPSVPPHLLPQEQHALSNQLLRVASSGDESHRSSVLSAAGPSPAASSASFRLRDWFDRGDGISRRDRQAFAGWNAITDTEIQWQDMQIDVENAARQMLALRAINYWRAALSVENEPFQSLAPAIGWAHAKGLLDRDQAHFLRHLNRSANYSKHEDPRARSHSLSPSRRRSPRVRRANSQ